MTRHISDPLEQMLADALDRAEVEYRHESQGGTKSLDFYLPDADIHIEVKQFHTSRTAEQIQRVPDVILLQGRRAVAAFCNLIDELGV